MWELWDIATLLQRQIDNILVWGYRSFCQAYIDDIVIALKTLEG
jgi:hypothetical protein